MGAGASVSPRSRSGRILLTSNGLSTPEMSMGMPEGWAEAEYMGKKNG